jgi:hypothetical protein
MGRPPIGKTAMTGAERVARYRAKAAATRAPAKPAPKPEPAPDITSTPKPAPDITIEMLSLSDRAKAEKYRRRLDREYAWKLEQMVRPEVVRRTEELRQHLYKCEAEAKALEDLWTERLAAHKGIMDRALFRQILARLHPDAGGKAHVFDAFKQLESKLIPGKDMLADRAAAKRKGGK